MYSYQSYGLHIHATLPLPELTPADGDADVVIREEVLPIPPEEGFEDGRYARAEADEAFLAWRGVVNIVVRGGREIVFHPHASVEPCWLRQYLLGPALGVLLHQRGLLVLHASAVALSGGAVAFVGWKGQGKSTTAGGLHRRGHGLLADDVVAVDLSDPERPLVMPGLRQVKLWPDAAAALDLKPEALTVLHPDLPKRARRVPASAAEAPCPLRGLYVLDHGEALGIEALPAVEAFGALVKHVYAARFIGRAGLPRWHFEQCVALARAVPVYRFRRQQSLALLPEALDLLEAQLTHRPQRSRSFA